MPTDLLLASAQPAWLVSVWKPILLLIPFVIWARIVTGVYDKHAAQYFLPRKMWNLVHLSAGLLAVVLAIVLGGVIGGEGGFWVALVGVIAILAGDLYAYMHMANKDDRVPESRRIRFGMAKPDPADAKNKKDAKLKGKAAQQIRLTIKSLDEKGKFSKTVEPPMPETPEFATRVAAEGLMVDAIANRAWQAEVGPGKDAYQARLLVDGVLQPGATFPPPEAAKIMDFWKASAKLDIADRRRRQVGDVQIETPDYKRVVRVTSIGAQGGMRVTMLLDPEKAVQKPLKDLGLLDTQLAELQRMAGLKGVVLVATPPDSGRTTLMYALLRLHDAYTSNVHTVEFEPQGAPEGVRVNKFDAEAAMPVSSANAAGPSGGPEYSTLVRSIMRRDPDVVAVSDMPDPSTAKEVAKIDQTRTRTYLCFKGSDAATVVQAYVKAVGETRQAAESLSGVVVGKLVRKLCTNCRVAYPPTPDMLKKLSIPEGKVQTLFKKGGQVLIKNKPDTCPVCKGSGYLGVEGVYEVFPIEKDEQDQIVQGNFTNLRGLWRKRSIPTLQQVAIRKAVEGLTSVEEIIRITSGEDAPEAAAGGRQFPDGHGRRHAGRTDRRPQ